MFTLAMRILYTLSPGRGDDGWPRQERGVSASVPGLYFAGGLFQYAFASMLAGGLGRDAEYIAARLPGRRRPSPRRAEPAAGVTPWP